MKRRPPYLSTVLATGLVLGLVGVYGLVLLQGRELVRALRESTRVVVEVRPGSSEAALAVLSDFLETRPYVKPGSITFVSEDEGAARLREEFGESFLDFDLDNPLYDVYTFNIPERFVDEEAVGRFRAEVDAQPAVLASYVQEDLVRTLTRRIGALAWVGLGLGAVLLLGVVFMVLNTTRLALLSRATLIRNMALVGASWGVYLPAVSAQGCLGGDTGRLAGHRLDGFGRGFRQNQLARRLAGVAAGALRRPSGYLTHRGRRTQLPCNVVHRATDLTFARRRPRSLSLDVLLPYPMAKTTSRPSAQRTPATPIESSTGAQIIVEESDLIFGRDTFLWIGGGIALMALGMILMAGGGMPSPDVWDEGLIYSFRRITLAPIVIIAGLGVITYAIFKK